MTLGAVILAGALGATSGQAVFVSPTMIAGDQVRLGDVADVSALPVALQGPAADLQLLRLKPGTGPVTISSTRLAERARGLMPVLGPWLEQTPVEVTITRAPPKVAEPRPLACQVLTAPVAAGQAVLASEVAPAPCDGATIPVKLALRGRAGTPTAPTDLAAGDLVAARDLSAYAVIRQGQELRLRTQTGAVSVERTASAVQSVRQGQAVFVRFGDGEVLRAGITP